MPWIFVVLASLTVGACLYDQRCGPAMAYDAAAGVCMCDSDAFAVTGGCQRCPTGEVAINGACGCPSSQTKDADGTCHAITGLGNACDTVSSPCADATYSYCAVHGGGTAGACTNQCTSNADCDPAYTCATWEAQPYCRSFDGVGASCVSSMDCTGDANFCDIYVSHRCGITGCSLTANNCPRDSLCCDYSAFGLGNICADVCR
jgi:hypothetical protein